MLGYLLANSASAFLTRSAFFTASYLESQKSMQLPLSADTTYSLQPSRQKASWLAHVAARLRPDALRVLVSHVLVRALPWQRVPISLWISEGTGKFLVGPLTNHVAADEVAVLCPIFSVPVAGTSAGPKVVRALHPEVHAPVVKRLGGLRDDLVAEDPCDVVRVHNGAPAGAFDHDLIMQVP
eukprot:CAMPEP_0117483516 /NCGR_PEP_ID=MMETSP0784-20121206/13977_1 /TAXON_ID=39447 /ORGANISM="" /LENGTH=181 /DNA_ID=CAMNT_0005278049 /DNA_START=77 /DNA_END=622 /DNA_ORIENTATION=+